MANYTRIKWGNGPVTAEKLNQMVANTDYLYDRMMRGTYQVGGIFKDANLVVQGVICSVTNNINGLSMFSNVYWPKPFSPGCDPVCGVSHYFTEAIIHNIGLRGMEGGVRPTNMGFRIETYAGKTEHGDERRGTHEYSVLALGW